MPVSTMPPALTLVCTRMGLSVGRRWNRAPEWDGGARMLCGTAPSGTVAPRSGDAARLDAGLYAHGTLSASCGARTAPLDGRRRGSCVAAPLRVAAAGLRSAPSGRGDAGVDGAAGLDAGLYAHGTSHEKKGWLARGSPRAPAITSRPWGGARTPRRSGLSSGSGGARMDDAAGLDAGLYAHVPFLRIRVAGARFRGAGDQFGTLWAAREHCAARLSLRGVGARSLNAAGLDAGLHAHGKSPRRGKQSGRPGCLPPAIICLRVFEGIPQRHEVRNPVAKRGEAARPGRAVARQRQGRAREPIHSPQPLFPAEDTETKREDTGTSKSSASSLSFPPRPPPETLLFGVKTRSVIRCYAAAGASSPFSRAKCTSSLRRCRLSLSIIRWR